jgi:hypothetical protein
VDRCSVCGGVFHPSTGSEVTTTYRRCGPCEKQFIRWLKGTLKRKGRDKLDFYTHAASSVRPTE